MTCAIGKTSRVYRVVLVYIKAKGRNLVLECFEACEALKSFVFWKL